jgi:hypothetical protein
MKDLVSNRRVSILAWGAGLSILWAVFAVSGDRPWAAYIWLGAMGLLIVSTAVMFLGGTRPTSLATVIQGVEDEPAERKS